MMKRVLCLYMPWLKVERLEPGEGGPGPEPLAVVEVQNGATVLVQANRAAGGLGVRRGMTLAESRALVPNLRTVDHDPDADRRTLEKLADWASCLSPIVHIEDETALLLDVTGCERLFQGEPNLVQRAVEGLREQGFTTRAALADTAGAAWALAHAHYEQTIIAGPGRGSAAIAPLPVWSLRVDARVVAMLRGVGVETVEALLHLPRASVAARFGDGLLRRLDEALGAVAEVLVPFRPMPAVTCSLRFGRATTRQDVLFEAFQRLLEEFCAELAQRGAGVRRVCVTLYGESGGPHTVDVQTSAATRSPRRLRSLGRVRLEALRLPSAVQGMSVWTREVEPLAEWQDEFFDTGRRDTEGLAELVDRLSVRLGPDGVRRVELVSDHQPEKGYRWGRENKKQKAKSKNEARRDGEKQKAKMRDEGTEGRRDEG
ncbi:MAG: DNA polymerase Y family protein, partial [Phycisphaerae bacterium]|nr:DNA polymerase Y family protein [Phycisphaerae bacterium]